MQSVPGMHDLIAYRFEQHAHIANTAASLAKTYRCREICTPLLERAEVFQRTLGEDTDVVRKKCPHYLSCRFIRSVVINV